MSYVISVPASSIQKAIAYGANVTSISTGVTFADGTTVTAGSTSASYPIDYAYKQANVATGIATSGYAQANSAAVAAQAAYALANSIAVSSGSVDLFARTQAANAIANTVYTQGVDVTQNTRLTVIQGVDTTQNNQITIIQGVDSYQNNQILVIQGVDAYQNNQITVIQGTNDTQNNQIAVIQGVDNTQNTNIMATDGKMQSAYVQANTGTVLAQAAYDTANSLVISGGVIDSYARSQAANAISNTIYTQGVDATQNTNIQTALSFINNGGTISGDLTVRGNLSILGTSTTINTSSLEVNDSLIYLANNNYISDSIDIGFIGHYNSTGNAHTGIIRDPNLKEYIIFQGYTPEVQSNNLINIAHSSFAYANLYVNTLKGNLIGTSAIVNGLELYNYSTATYSRANTSSNSFTGTTGSATPSSGIVTLTSTNGVTVTGSGSTLTINTPQNLQTTGTPTFGSLTLTSALALSQGGTGATSAAAALTSLLPTGTTSGYVLTTGGPGTFYWAAGGSGGSSATPGTTIASTRVSATGNGTGLAYSTPVYTAGASQLRVYINGVRQFASEYTETSGNTASSGIVTFSTSPASGSAILFEVDGYIINPYYANNITFTAPQGSISSTANTIQLAIQDLESRKATLASPSFTGLATATTIDTNASNTAIATTAFVKNALNNSNTYTMSVSGNAGTVTNGVYTNGSYSDPTWITSLAGSKISGAISGNAGTVTNGFYTTSSFNLGTTSVAINRTSALQSLTGISIDGNAGTVTNGVYTNGSYSDPSWITSLAGSKISGNITGNAGTATTATASNAVNSPDGDRNAATKLPTTSGNKVRFDFSSASSAGTGGNYAGVMTYAPWDGTTASTGDASYQLAFGSTATNGSGVPRLNIRKGIDSTWNSWYTLIHTGYTAADQQFNSIGINTAASGTAGEIRATNEITAYYSDDRLKTKLGKIENALDKLCSLEGFYYEANETAQALGYKVKREVGISAQDTQKVLPEIVKPAPIDEKYLTISYEKFAPLFVEAIKELRNEIQEIKDKLK